MKENYRKVIFHIDEIEKWTVLLANLGNLLVDQTTTGWSVDVLVNGAAAKVFKNNLKDDLYIEKMAVLSDQGVKFTVCNNSLRGLTIAPADLPAFDSCADGVVYLVQQQADGYAYIKP